MDEKEIDYMNVIPLVDVMLVLLTIVLTASTFIATGGIPITLPRSSDSQEEIQKVQTVEIDRIGQIYLNTQPLTLEELKNSLRTKQKGIPVLIRADRDIALQVFVDVLDVVKSQGFTKVSLQTEIQP